MLIATGRRFAASTAVSIGRAAAARGGSAAPPAVEGTHYRVRERSGLSDTTRFFVHERLSGGEDGMVLRPTPHRWPAPSRFTLNEEQLAEVQRRRAEDPAMNTARVLAIEFQTSPYEIMRRAPLSTEVRAVVAAESQQKDAEAAERASSKYTRRTAHRATGEAYSERRRANREKMAAVLQEYGPNRRLARYVRANVTDSFVLTTARMRRASGFSRVPSPRKQASEASVLQSDLDPNPLMK